MRWPSFFIFIAMTAFALRPLAAVADEKLTPEQLDKAQWKFSPFLSGSTLQIRDLINGPLEEQLHRKAIKTRQIESDEAAIVAKEEAAGAKLREVSPAFARMQDELGAAKAKVADARKASDAVALIDAQNTADSLRARIIQQEDASISNDADVTGWRKEIKETQDELRDLEPAIARAGKARDQMIDALRLSRKIPGPPAVGGNGILGRLTPTKIIDTHSFVADFEADEITGENKNAKAPDGMKSITGIAHWVSLRVTGVDTTKLHVGTETIIDHTFCITGTKQMGKETVYIVAPIIGDQRQQEYERLFELLDELRMKS